MGLGTGAFDYFESQKKLDEITKMQKAIKLTRIDGLNLTALEYSLLLFTLAKENKIKVDYYSRGGIVEELENKFASWLGKERAIFMPTGTLANHIAIHKLAGEKRRVIVQAESHVYNDCGDCVQNLSGINMIPIGYQKATFTRDDIKKELARSAAGRVETKIGAISIESPVRRKNGEIFSFDEMKKISDFARNKGIKLHLDGARLFIASAHTGIRPSGYADLFDTVYISLYKCFNASFGAILAGPRRIIEGLFHVRRFFGGGLLHVWPAAAVALQYVDSYIEEYSNSLNMAENFFKLIQKNGAFKVERIPNGTNVVKLYVKGTDLFKFRRKLHDENIYLPMPQKNWNGFVIKINPTLNRTNAQRLAEALIKAL